MEEPFFHLSLLQEARSKTLKPFFQLSLLEENRSKAM
jgi:hypothetical protein